MKKIYKQISGALLMLTLILNITAYSPGKLNQKTSVLTNIVVNGDYSIT